MSGETNEVVWRGVRPVSGIRGVWPARNAVRVVKNGYVSGVATVIIYTPAAGKKLFITSAFIAVRMGSANSAWGGVGVRDGGDVHLYYFAVAYQVVVGSYNTPATYFPALEVEAGWDVFVKSSHADLDCNVCIIGWLEDV